MAWNRVALLIHFILILVFYATRNNEEACMYLFNADCLYIPSLYKDLVVNGNSINGWHTTPAPYLFPDIIFYFLIQSFIPNFRIAMMVYGILQYFTMILLLQKITRSALPDIAENVLALSSLMMSAFLLADFFYHDYLISGFVVSISFHLGAFITGLLLLYFLILYIRSRKQGYLLFIFILGVLGVVSDKLITVIFFIPAVLLLLKASFRSARLLIPVGVIILSYGTGWWLLSYISEQVVGHIPDAAKLSVDSGVSKELFIRHLGQFLNPFRVFATVIVIAALSLILLTLTTARQWMQKLSPASFYVSFTALSGLLIIFTPVFTGLYQGLDSLRYSISGYFLLIFSFPAAVWLVFKKPVIFKIITPLITIALGSFSCYLLFTHPVMKGLRNFSTYKPPLVRELDELPATLRNGMSDYWLAKPVTLFSDRNLVCVPIFESLLPYLHEVNEEQYLGRKNRELPVFDFIIEFPPNERSGVAIDTLYADGVPVYLIRETTFRRSQNGGIELNR